MELLVVLTIGSRQTWLTCCSQCVALDSESSSFVPVLSGVPQSTVLSPLMFLLYINDIAKGINSPLRLFADDFLLYRVINGVVSISRIAISYGSVVLEFCSLPDYRLAPEQIKY